MTTSDVMHRAWAALEGEAQPVEGVYQRRVHANSGLRIFACLLHPSRLLRVSMEVSSDVATDGLERGTRGFRVQRHYEPAADAVRISLDLSSAGFREVFTVMAEDVTGAVVASPDETEAVRILRCRLDHWERFMRSTGPEGLSREDQVGLFGELTFLEALLQAGIAGDAAVGWWHGPAGENQDFQAGLAAVEVKTTAANSPSSIPIANELQLDETHCHPLHLLHVWLGEIDGSGRTLPQIIDDISTRLDSSALQSFHDRLLEAGYHEVHRSLYSNTGWLVRARRCFAVDGAFPRVRRTDLREGVSRVEYRIDVAGFGEYERSHADVIEALRAAAEHQT
jgi:Putative  PD-(D/E)XK family member, (DUF4420)